MGASVGDICVPSFTGSVFRGAGIGVAGGMKPAQGDRNPAMEVELNLQSFDLPKWQKEKIAKVFVVTRDMLNRYRGDILLPEILSRVEGEVSKGEFCDIFLFLVNIGVFGDGERVEIKKCEFVLDLVPADNV